jgi:hypothetical protein
MKGGSYKDLPSIFTFPEATDRYSFSMKLLLIVVYDTRLKVIIYHLRRFIDILFKTKTWLVLLNSCLEMIKDMSLKVQKDKQQKDRVQITGRFSIQVKRVRTDPYFNK